MFVDALLALLEPGFLVIGQPGSGGLGHRHLTLIAGLGLGDLQPGLLLLLLADVQHALQ